MAIKRSTIHELHIERLSAEQSEIVAALLDHLDVTALEEREGSIVIYDDDKARLDHLLSGLMDLAPWISPDQVSRNTRPNENWNKSWESSFSPIVVEDFCTIKATFHDIHPTTRHVITIDPEMAFGTGHHETTYAMMRMMQKLDFQEASVMDYGTGTGILAILSEQLGASSIYAFDYDDVATECAKRCVSVNKCSRITIGTAMISDLPVDKNYDVILANINRQVLLDTAEDIYLRLSEQGTLLLSGIMLSDETIIVECYTRHGFTLAETMIEGEWLCLRMQK